MLLLWLACAAPVSSGETGPLGSDTGEIELPALLRLPWAVVGDPAPNLEVTGIMGASVEGPFLLTQEGGGVRISLDDPMSAPGLFAGSLVVVGGTIPVYAVVGDPALPATVDWQTDTWGTWAIAALPSAPFPYQGSSWDDPSVLVALPAGFSPSAESGEVLHIHGFNATLSEVVAEQYLREQASIGGRNALLVIPQGPEEAASGDFGGLAAADGAANLLRDAISLAWRDGLIDRAALGPVVLTSHSGGYQATARILEQAGIEVVGVHLFDSLYAEVDTFEAYAKGGGRLRSVYTASGGTSTENQAMAADLAAAGIAVGADFDDSTLDAAQVIVGFTTASHSGCVSEDRAYGRWLRASGLPAAPGAPPELLVVEAAGESMTLTWREDGGPWVVESSADGASWSTAAESAVGSASVPLSPFVRVRGAGEPSDVYGATGEGWWVIDGFDRVFGGSWTAPTHDFTGQVVADLGVAASSASNEAEVDLSGAEGLVWLLGDESMGDHSFTATEEARIEAFLDQGGRVILSGAELGYATDPDWLARVFGVSLVADDAGTDQVEGFTIGAAYPEDYPDVLDGPEVIWRYASGGAAAVRSGRAVLVGFGIENIDPAERAAALAVLVAATGG